MHLHVQLRPIQIDKYSIPFLQGRSQTFSFGGTLEGPVLQQGELSMVCVGLSERDLKNFCGARQNFGGQCPPWHPPSSAPAFLYSILGSTQSLTDCSERQLVVCAKYRKKQLVRWVHLSFKLCTSMNCVKQQKNDYRIFSLS